MRTNNVKQARCGLQNLWILSDGPTCRSLSRQQRDRQPFRLRSARLLHFFTRRQLHSEHAYGTSYNTLHAKFWLGQGHV